MTITYIRAGEQPAIAVGTTGAGATPDLPNHGVSVITATSSEVYTLMPPRAGVKKTIVFNGSSATTLAPIVRGSSAQTVTFSGGTLGGNTALPTMFKLAATRSTKMAVSVELMGLSSTSWLVTSVHPVQLETTLAATVLGSGSVTFSTT
jgi:hypothetical protein